MNLNQEIQTATDKIIKDKLPSMIEDKVSSMLDDVLDDIFRSYNDTAKQVKQKIEEKLDINLAEFDLIDYNGLVARTINDQLVETVNMESLKKLTKDITGVINKKEIDLSEIVDMFINASMETDETKNEGSISLYVEVDTKYDWTAITVDLEGDKDKDDCAFEFLVSGRHGHIFSIRHKREYYESDRHKISPLKVAELNKLEHLIFRFYSACVTVNVDRTDFETYWYRNY